MLKLLVTGSLNNAMVGGAKVKIMKHKNNIINIISAIKLLQEELDLIFLYE
jgi:hypothetical protein